MTQASDLSGALDSSSIYVIDGDIDMGSQTIEVPATGLTIRGLSKRTSRLRSSASSYTMFTSPIGGSGNILIFSLTIVVNGVSSQVYDVKSVNGSQSIETKDVIYAFCTSLGLMENWYQGAESTVVRYGGTPTLTLAGVWLGYSLNFCIVANLNAGMTTSLFSAGTGLSFVSRFTTNITVDLPALASFCDYTSANFVLPSSFRLNNAKFTRLGSMPLESENNILPNISHDDLKCIWLDNDGITNTHIGGAMTLSTQNATVINTTSTFERILGTFTLTNAEHFSMDINGEIKHEGSFPNEFWCFMNGSIEGPANAVLTVRLMRYQTSTTNHLEIIRQQRVVNNNLGSRDVAFFNILGTTKLWQGDYVYVEVSNETNTSDVTLELDSFLNVIRR